MMNDQILIEQLNNQPDFKNHVIELLELINNSKGNLITADQAESQLVKNLPRLGQEVLSAWARQAEQVCVHNAQLVNHRAIKHGKKKSTGIQFTDESNY